MALDKNKQLIKGGKKKAKEKVVDPFSKKDWYDVKAPAMFNIRGIWENTSQGSKIVPDSLKGHVFEPSLADLPNDEVTLRKKMTEIMNQEVQTNAFKEVVNKLIPHSVGKDIEKACQSISPLHDVFIKKVKMLKKPKFELGKLMEFYGEGGSSGKTTEGETGAKVEQADRCEPPIQEYV
ncbi:40S ribosomal protein S3a-like [Tupaia chinensis]|uniref:40S ribosomal protein S3a-like n=1 Tax=Tupaia chinensis TaxID=246437 RepID=UPI0003C91B1F|nr:40S ribosomal protein S3a-like [Tupaia chinensis]